MRPYSLWIRNAAWALTIVGIVGAFSTTSFADEGNDPGASEVVLDTSRVVTYQPVESEDSAEVSEPDAVATESVAEAAAESKVAVESTVASSESQASTFVPQGVSLPSGESKSGVTGGSISVPSGPATIQGMDESFTVGASTGVASYAIPFTLPTARGAVQPALALGYSSSGGVDVGGYGWGLRIASISRQTDKGIPKYDDRSDWHPEQDRFVFSGGGELVPICLVDQGNCAGALPGELMPVWADGWQYFRSRVDGGFQRFFWSPDHLTWRVQEKSGVTSEFGVPLDGTGYAQGIERNADRPLEVYKWHLVRQFDVQTTAQLGPDGLPAPANVVYYRYFSTGNRSYLTDVFDTSLASDPSSLDFTGFAHHTRLVYAQRTDPTTSYRSGFRIDQTLRLVRVDVASKNFAGTGPRELVRRYHLTYSPDHISSLLRSVQLEGTCAGAFEVDSAAGESLQCATGTNCAIVPPTECPRLPAMTFEYSHVVEGQTFEGFEEFNTVVTDVPNSPPFSLDAAAVDFFDVNADALPDVIATAPELFGGQHAAYFNLGSAPSDPGFEHVAMGILSGTASPAIDTKVLNLGNPNVRPLDVDGDGVVDLVHMPRVKAYNLFTPRHNAGTWNWEGRGVTTASGQDVKIDFTTDAVRVRTADVNFDGLIDIVASTGTQLQTFFALGRYPGGDGQFGHATWTSKDTATMSNDPVTSCVPWSGTSAGFEDPDIDLADMNGDGIVDIVRFRPNDVRYWPGRGNGTWGTGARDDCLEGSFGEDRHVQMANPPTYEVEQGESLLVDDVNGDGLADLVEVRFNNVDVYLNVNGAAWTPRRIISNTPPKPSSTNRVRLTDLDGSGTLDVVWGNADAYKLLDLQGGRRSRLLTAVHNGLGATTRIAYSTSTQQMLAAAALGDAWAAVMPTVVPVVESITRTANLAISGRPAQTYTTQYAYRDPLYEGRQREFRGFRNVEVAQLGDGNSPTGIAETEFLLGECVDEDLLDGVDACAPAQRWMDNPREALKGANAVSHKYDGTGKYLSTVLNQQRLTDLYQGRDGRVVRFSYAASTRTYLYDYDAFVPEQTTIAFDAVERPGVDCVDVPEACEPIAVSLASSVGRVRLEQEQVSDLFGNVLTTQSLGCVDGCSAPDEVISNVALPVLLDHPSGWLWRNEEEFVEGDLHADLRNHVRHTYDALGQLQRTEAFLSGSLPLAPLDPSVVPNPQASSLTPDWIDVVSDVVYDAFGNPLRHRGPNGRCADSSYDTVYGQLVVAETAYSGGCDVGPLATSAIYDRGFELTTQVIDVQLQQTDVVYDGFGRPKQLYRPHADPTGTCALPAVEFDYYLPPSAGSHHSVIVSRTRDAADCSAGGELLSYQYVDGLGRTLGVLSEADTSAGFGNDQGQWIVSGQVDYDAKGSVRQAYLPHFVDGDPLAFDFSAAPAAQYGSQSYDAFGRKRVTRDLDMTPTLSAAYHALSSDLSDAADLEPMGAHTGTPVTQRKDGHGRAVESIERFKAANGSLEARHTLTEYLPTGEPERITRRRATTGQEVVRWMRYDSLGRTVLNVEPNSSVGFTTDLEADPDTIAAWRYAYDDAGDLVGMTDARGCGRGFAFDGLGRLRTEDYYPCSAEHPAYTPLGQGSVGAEVYNHYDTIPANLQDDGELVGFFSEERFLKGRLVRVMDRASDALVAFDGRGRVKSSARRITGPSPPSPELQGRYAPRWYRKNFQYDAADRVVREDTGARTAELLGDDGTSAVSITYTGRGSIGRVDGSYGVLVDSLIRTADGLTLETVHGDLARTRTTRSYDTRRRLQNLTTFRSAPGTWPADHETASPQTFQMLLRDDEYVYDVVGNPTSIIDHRTPNEWPAGAKPVDRTMAYDDLYRLRTIDYEHDPAVDQWLSPLDAEIGGVGNIPNPNPHIAFPNRVQQQTYDYDWLGNTQSTSDDADGFYDRSLGTVVNGTSSDAPYQLRSASLAGANGGALQAAYDESGNMVRVLLERNGACLPVGTSCDQWYEYEWDEIGRLSRARRWDGPGRGATPQDPLPTDPPAADLAYAYDANDQRALKATTVGSDVRYTAYIFGSLELRRAEWLTDDYERTAQTETVYLAAQGANLGRVVFEPDVDPAVVDADAETPDPTDVQSVPGSRRVFFELGDHLGSTGAVLDKASSELVERTTYLAYGTTESDYRPSRWNAFREDYKFTGKEEDVEVGLVYFGKRYLNTSLQRWVSADPLEIHSPGEADANSYAYVLGRALAAVDPMGLDDTSLGQLDVIDGTDQTVLPMTDQQASQFVGMGYSEAEVQSAWEFSHGSDGQQWPGMDRLPAINRQGPGSTAAYSLRVEDVQRYNTYVESVTNRILANTGDNGWQGVNQWGGLSQLTGQSPEMGNQLRLRDLYTEGMRVAAIETAMAAPMVVGPVGGALGLGGAAAGGASGGGRTFYRLITSNDELWNFTSNAAKGFPARGVERGNALLHQGISVFSTPAQAATRIPVIEAGSGLRVLGIAELNIAEGTGVAATRTLGRGHYTLTGDPAKMAEAWRFSITTW